MKKIAVLILILAMALSMAACGKANGPTYHFEIVSKGFQITYWQAVYKGAQSEVEKLNRDAGYEMISMNFVGPDSESDVAAQVEQFTSALNAKPSAIGFAAVDQDAFLELLESALQKKLPIIGFDSGVPGAPEGSVYANASTDNYAAGKLAADEMWDKISDRIAAADGAVRIGEINQDAVSESVTLRGIGFIDEIIAKAKEAGYGVAVTGSERYITDCAGSTANEADAKIIIEVRVPSQITVEQCAAEATAVLNKADTLAVFGSNQTAAEGIVTANESLSVCGCNEDQIIAVGFDSGAPLKAAIRDGAVYGAVTQSPVSIGRITIDLLLAAAKGESVADTDTGCAFYTAENIDSEEIAQNLYD